MSTGLFHSVGDPESGMYALRNSKTGEWITQDGDGVRSLGDALKFSKESDAAEWAEIMGLSNVSVQSVGEDA